MHDTDKRAILKRVIDEQEIVSLNNTERKTRNLRRWNSILRKKWKQINEIKSHPQSSNRKQRKQSLKISRINRHPHNLPRPLNATNLEIQLPLQPRQRPFPIRRPARREIAIQHNLITQLHLDDVPQLVERLVVVLDARFAFHKPGEVLVDKGHERERVRAAAT